MKSINNPFVLEILNQNSDMPKPTIPAYLHETYAQAYEDIIIDSLIMAYCKEFKYPTENFKYIEIGANHPINTSSTFLWNLKYGITGFLVEANPSLIPALKQYRPNDVIINAAVYDENISFIDLHIGNENEVSSINETFVSNWKNQGVNEKISVPVIRINELLAKIEKDKLIILVIDVESLDLRLLKDINFDQYKPFIIEIEPSDFFIKGNTKSIISFLSTKGYKLVAATSVNLIFQLKY